MNHGTTKRKFGREKNQRNALIKSLALSLVVHKKIETTLAKAKEIRPVVEKLVTKGKANTLASRRLILERIGSERAVKILVDEIAPKYKERNGGYTRITKLPRRKKDASPMAMIEFV
jgi:large subunit ribosomal protein L17